MNVAYGLTPVPLSSLLRSNQRVVKVWVHPPQERDQLWAIKTTEHRGEGIRLLPFEQALQVVSQPTWVAHRRAGLLSPSVFI
jgi:hypothetical protein